MNVEQKKTKKIIFLDILTYLVLVLLLFVLCLPFISMLGTAIKERQAALTTISLFPASFDQISFSSFETVLFKTTFMRNVLNSLIVAGSVTLICIIVASFAGYAISRFKGPYFKFYSILLLLLQMFPVMLLLMPLYVIYNKLQMVNTLWSVGISYTTMNLAFCIWMLKGFFDSIPRDLEGAAIVDGCTRFEAFIKIIMPLALPGIATVAIFTVLNAWNEYTLASIFLRKDQVMTITVGLQRFVQQNGADWPKLMAASTIATIPTVLFMLFAQKYLIEGMTAGAVKG